jgi:hypothetical protein
VSARGYVTSAVCANCHGNTVTEVEQSGHPYKINPVVAGVPPTYPFNSVPNPPVGFTWNDISYVIGGYGWKARFMDLDGYILVDGVTGVNVQYNLPRDELGDGLPATWSGYHAGDTKPKPYTCGTCHYRDTDHGILVSGGYGRHHEQYDELISSGHNALSAVDCHDPHVGVRYGNAQAGGISITCESCHSDKTVNQHAVPVDCVDRHMSRASKSSRALNTFQGDLRTHILAINSDEVTKDDMWYDVDGTAFARPWVTLDFACYGCHTEPVTDVGGGRPSPEDSQMHSPPLALRLTALAALVAMPSLSSCAGPAVAAEDTEERDPIPLPGRPAARGGAGLAPRR